MSTSRALAIQSRQLLRPDYSKFARSAYRNTYKELEPETFAESSRLGRRRPSISHLYEYHFMIEETAS